MAVLNESDYKTIYNVPECAGITNFDTSASNTLANYNKIADWINSDETLSQLFTATVTTVSPSSRYRLDILTSTGAGMVYGYRAWTNNASDGDHTSKSYRYANTSSANTSITDVSESIPLSYLNLMLIKSKHGFIADLFNSTQADRRYSIRLVHTTGIDDSGEVKDITMFGFGDYFNTIVTPFVWSAAVGYLENNSASNKTGLFTLMVPGRDIICENVKLCVGRIIDNQTFFGAGGKTWCCAAYDAAYKGLALCIE